MRKASRTERQYASPRGEGGRGIGQKLFCLLSTLVLAAVGFLFVSRQFSSAAVVSATAALKDVLDIDELSTAEFIYNGIAQVPEDDNPEKVRFYVCYNSTVKVGISLEEVSILSIDQQENTVRVSVPSVAMIGEPIIDHNHLSCMKPGVFSSFSPNDYDFKVAYEACLQDAAREASSSADLFAAAEDNLKTTLQALLVPIVGDGFTYEWVTPGQESAGGAEEASAEGGA